MYVAGWGPIAEVLLHLLVFLIRAPTVLSVKAGGCGGLPHQGRSGGGALKTLGKRNVSGRAAVGSTIASSVAAVSRDSRDSRAGEGARTSRSVNNLGGNLGEQLFGEWVLLHSSTATTPRPDKVDSGRRPNTNLGGNSCRGREANSIPSPLTWLLGILSPTIVVQQSGVGK